MWDFIAKAEQNKRVVDTNSEQGLLIDTDLITIHQILFCE